MEAQIAYDLGDIHSVSVTCIGCDAEVVRRLDTSNTSAYLPARCPLCNSDWAQDSEDDPNA